MSDEKTTTDVTGMSNRAKTRLENKKRKIEAFLDLASTDPDYLEYREKRFKNGSYSEEDSSSCSLANLRAKVREVKKHKGPPPSFDLLEPGIRAQVSVPVDGEYKLTAVPLYVGDVQQLLLKAVLSMGSPCRPRWCSVYQSHAINNVLLIVVEGLSKDAVIHNQSVFPNVASLFQNMVEIVTPCRYSSSFSEELCELSLSFCYEITPNARIKTWNMVPCNAHKPLESIVPVVNNRKRDADPDEGFSRLHLLLSPIQMVMENFPLPQGVFQCANTEGYNLTKDIYSPVTAKSPMFALDCEMCRVVSGRMEVARVALVNEELETVYCSLVKPREKIIDYVTKFSGITEKMLKPVTTRLEDVQNKIKELLPPDAILCGQSLNFDLHALRVIHPYIIDTSVIYNTTGCRTRKTALKVLSSTFLNEKIQDGEKGHHPVEDCIATMKLVQLKLQNGPQFGDSILSSKVSTKTESDEQNSPDSSDIQNSENSGPTSTSFFAQFLAEKKSSLIVVHEECSDLYPQNMLNESVLKKSVSSNRKLLKCTLKEMSDYNLTLSHFRFPSDTDSSQCFLKIDKWVRKLYEACARNSLLVFVGPGLKDEEGRFRNGFCQVKIKDQ